MKSKRGPKAREQRPQRKGGQWGRPAGKAAAKPGARPRRWGAGPSAARGPKHCPMCGAVVENLGRHIRERHDDATSHPRD